MWYRYKMMISHHLRFPIVTGIGNLYFVMIEAINGRCYAKRGIVTKSTTFSLDYILPGNRRYCRKFKVCFESPRTKVVPLSLSAGSLVLSKSATQSPRTKVEVTECRTLSSIRNTQNKYIFLYRHGFYDFYKNNLKEWKRRCVSEWQKNISTLSMLYNK